MCFRSQTQICLSEFLVTAESLLTKCLYPKILNFAALLNNGSILFVEIKSNVKCSWWIKQETYCVEEVALEELVCFGLFSATSQTVSITRSWFELNNFINWTFKKCVCSKSPLFDQTIPLVCVIKLFVIPIHLLCMDVQIFLLLLFLFLLQ